MDNYHLFFQDHNVFNFIAKIKQKKIFPKTKCSEDKFKNLTLLNSKQTNKIDVISTRNNLITKQKKIVHLFSSI